MVPTAHPSHKAKRHFDRFSRFRMGLKCYAVHCIFNGEENAKIAPSPWDCVTLLEEDRATAIGNMRKKLVKIARVIREICSRTDRQTHTHSHADVLITILRHCCCERSNYCVASSPERMLGWT